MAFQLQAWAGDHAGTTIGREPFRALVSLTHSNGDFPANLFKSGDLDGITWFYEWSVTCLTPGAMPAIVTKVEEAGDYVWSIEVTPHDWGDKAAKAWKPGVHLFSLMLYGPGGNQSGTIATVVVPDRRFAPVKLSATALQKMVLLQQRRTQAR